MIGATRGSRCSSFAQDLAALFSLRGKWRNTVIRLHVALGEHTPRKVVDLNEMQFVEPNSAWFSLTQTMSHCYGFAMLWGLNDPEAEGNRRSFTTLRSHPATALYGSVALSFVIPSSRLAEASRERNDKACALCNIER